MIYAHNTLNTSSSSTASHASSFTTGLLLCTGYCIRVVAGAVIHEACGGRESADYFCVFDDAVILVRPGNSFIHTSHASSFLLMVLLRADSVVVGSYTCIYETESAQNIRPKLIGTPVYGALPPQVQQAKQLRGVWGTHARAYRSARGLSSSSSSSSLLDVSVVIAITIMQ